MTTTFTLLRQRCGLSQQEAAAVLNVPLDAVKSWDSSRGPTPDGAIAALRNFYRHLENTAERTAQRLSEIAPRAAILELGIAADDHEAQHLGFPCVGAHEALLGLVAAKIDRPVRVVPRGSTPATAAAIQAREESLNPRRS